MIYVYVEFINMNKLNGLYLIFIINIYVYLWLVVKIFILRKIDMWLCFEIVLI